MDEVSVGPHSAVVLTFSPEGGLAPNKRQSASTRPVPKDIMPLPIQLISRLSLHQRFFQLIWNWNWKGLIRLWGCPCKFFWAPFFWGRFLTSIKYSVRSSMYVPSQCLAVLSATESDDGFGDMVLLESKKTNYLYRSLCRVPLSSAGPSGPLGFCLVTILTQIGNGKRKSFKETHSKLS